MGEGQNEVIFLFRFSSSIEFSFMRFLICFPFFRFIFQFIGLDFILSGQLIFPLVVFAFFKFEVFLKFVNAVSDDHDIGIS